MTETKEQWAVCPHCNKPIKGSDANYGGPQWHGKCYKEAYQIPEKSSALSDLREAQPDR